MLKPTDPSVIPIASCRHHVQTAFENFQGDRGLEIINWLMPGISGSITGTCMFNSGSHILVKKLWSMKGLRLKDQHESEFQRS